MKLLAQVLRTDFFVIANFGLYGAFQRGPVWLAAPIVACFSVISVSWAVINGSAVSVFQWLAVLAILVGIAIVAILSDNSQTDIPSKGKTIVYALASAFGFSGTFAFGQMATDLSTGMMSALGMRIVAIGVTVAILLALRLPFWPGRKALWILAVMGLADCIAILSVVSAGGLEDAQYAAVATSMYGLPAIWLAATFLNERMTPFQWVGCLVVFAGVGYLSL